MSLAINTKTMLLGALVVLLVLKFGVSPLIEWQSETMVLIKSEKKKLRKVKSAIDNAVENQEQLDFLTMLEGQVDQQFFPSLQQSLFDLQQQTWLEDQFLKHNLTIQEFAWEPMIVLGGSKGIKEHAAQINFTGKKLDFIKLQNTLAADPRYIRFESFELAIRRHLQKSLGTVNGSAKLVFYSLGDIQ